MFRVKQQMVKRNRLIVIGFLNEFDLCYGREFDFLANSIRFETEQEEKRLLQEQLRQCEITLNETTSKLSTQIENVK